MPIEGFALTHPGAVRLNNEDALRFDPELAVAVLADGMGGANCGEVASAITVETICAYLHEQPEDGLDPACLLKEAVRAANRRVWQASQANTHCTGMGSTVVAAHWRGNRLWIVNVGDSRAYLWRSRELRQLSYDQNVANDLRSSLGLSDEEISKFPQRNALTMAIGTSPEVLVREHDEELMPGDVILLCSDGLYGPVGDTALARLLSAQQALPGLAAELIEAANNAGGPDNISVAVLRSYQG